jgi:hypothetical protein
MAIGEYNSASDSGDDADINVVMRVVAKVVVW